MIIHSVIVPANARYSSSVRVNQNGTRRPITVICPAALDGTKFDIAVKIDGHYHLITDVHGSSNETEFLFEANGAVLIHEEVVGIMANNRIMVYCETTQTVPRTFKICWTP